MNCHNRDLNAMQIRKNTGNLVCRDFKRLQAREKEREETNKRRKLLTRLVFELYIIIKYITTRYRMTLYYCTRR